MYAQSLKLEELETLRFEMDLYEMLESLNVGGVGRERLEVRKFESFKNLKA